MASENRPEIVEFFIDMEMDEPTDLMGVVTYIQTQENRVAELQKRIAELEAAEETAINEREEHLMQIANLKSKLPKFEIGQEFWIVLLDLPTRRYAAMQKPVTGYAFYKGSSEFQYAFSGSHREISENEMFLTEAEAQVVAEGWNREGPPWWRVEE
jgi:hypothetical protein